MSVTNTAVRYVVREQLKTAGMASLDLDPVKDECINGHIFAVFSSCVIQDNSVYDAFIVSGGGLSTIYNRENYPQYSDAVAAHIGRLVLDGKFKITQPRAKRAKSI